MESPPHQNAHFADLGSTLLKTDIRFETSTFEKGAGKNIAKIKKLIFFWPKMLKFGILESKFFITKVRFEIITPETGYKQILVRLESRYFWPQIFKI